MEKLKKKIINAAVNHYKLVFIIMIMATLVMGMFLPRIKLDTDPENMLRNDEPVRIFHNNTKKQFDLSETIVLGVINDKHPDGVFNPETLTRIYELTRFAKNLQWEDKDKPGHTRGVIEVDMLAPSVSDHMSQLNPGEIKFEWLMPKPPETREEALEIKERMLSNQLLKGRMVSENGKAICLYLPLTHKLLSYKVFTELSRKIEELGGDEEYHVTGLPVAEGAVGVEMFTEMGIASPLSMAVILGLLFLFFRKWELIILPMIISTISVIFTMGLIIACGFQVHILSSMLPVFLMSISIVDSVHVLSEFFDVYTKEKGRKESIKEVMNSLFMPMFYTSLTTAVGFLSLVLTPIPPAQIFGGFLSIGVMVAWICTIMFAPAYIMLIPEKKLRNFGLAAHKGDKKNLLTRMLNSVGVLTYKHSKAFIAAFVVIVCIACWGITQIRINDNFSKRFTPNHPIRKADLVLNNTFGGTFTAYLVLKETNSGKLSAQNLRTLHKEFTAFTEKKKGTHPNIERFAFQIEQEFDSFELKDMTLSAFLDSVIDYIEKLSTDSSDEDFYIWQDFQEFFGVEKERLKTFKRPEVLKYMADLQTHLEKSGLVGKCNSIADIVRKVNQELTDGTPENFRIPDKLQSVSECFMQFQQGHRPQDLWHMVTPDYLTANIMVQLTTGNSLDMEAIAKEVDNYVKANKAPLTLSYQWAGLHYVNLIFQYRMFWGMLCSFIGSFLIVLVMMSVFFRSIKWGLLCMVPLSITILSIYGSVGIIGKDYDMPVAILSVLSIGIAVDFAIHFLVRSRGFYSEEGSWEKVFPRMFSEPARAITRNVMVIAIGFLPLTVANLVPYKITGMMLFTILSISGFVTLLVLSAVLHLAESFFFKKINADYPSLTEYKEVYNEV